MRFIRFVMSTVLGCLLGIGLFQLESSGFFERWGILVNPSSEIRDYFTPGNIPDQFGNPQSCDNTFPEFSFPSNYPNNLVRCVQTLFIAADAFTRSVYVIDDKGVLWSWSHFSYAYDEFTKMFLYPILGLGFGILIGALINNRIQVKSLPSRSA